MRLPSPGIPKCQNVLATIDEATVHQGDFDIEQRIAGQSAFFHTVAKCFLHG